MAEREQRAERAARRTITIPYFWGWVAFTIIAAIVVILTFVHPFIVPKSVVLSFALVCVLWWEIGGLFFRVRYVRVIRRQRRGGLRIGGWALDGWHARYQRRGSYWRAMLSWVRSPAR